MNNNQIKYMVDRFLGWKLPENFNPDGGISFKKAINENRPDWPQKNEPVGTNLLDATQAEEMVRYMIDGLPAMSEHQIPPEIIEEMLLAYENTPQNLDGTHAMTGCLSSSDRARTGGADRAHTGVGNGVCMSEYPIPEDLKEMYMTFPPMHPGQRLIERIARLESENKQLREALEWALPFAEKAPDPNRSPDDTPSLLWRNRVLNARAALQQATGKKAR